ncbi:MAG: hypothetical protein MMC33_009157 [Icmadophila ericetorum]|nr:hypothetical protein [Icmadophila ericetorum]
MPCRKQNPPAMRIEGALHHQKPVPFEDHKNPKRCPAYMSVCLRPSSSGCSALQAKRPGVGSQSSISTEMRTPLTGDANTTNARTWFEDSNKNASSTVAVPFLDNDPPFYLRHNTSSDNDNKPSDTLHRRRRDSTGKGSMLRSPSSRLDSSNSEDFRSVIDDLTVENKKLKQKLRKYERLHCSTLESDKLFEVRIHGLPAYKKQEFEAKLRDFASSIGNSPGGDSGEQVNHRELVALRRLPSGDKGSSTSPTFSRPADSGYASMSASLKTSVSQLRHSEEPRTPPINQVGDQNVRSYLHDLPPGLIPQQSNVLSEKAKIKLVVRRLEQLFAGKVAPSAPPFQFLQQQKVSRSAAKAERVAKEARGHKTIAEGNREARMLWTGVYQSLDSKIENQTPRVLRTFDESDEFSFNGLYTSSEAIPDQRPTRPLDLDPNRAQVPADNIEYIRHLGLASPQISPSSFANHGEGWVYLNLLINMAQLHTINVTPEFVRKAVKDASEKFELSDDGQKIRWTGGHEGTQLSSDSGSNSRNSNEDLSPGIGQGGTNGSGINMDGFNGSEAELSSGSAKQASLQHNSSAAFGAEFDRRPIFLGQFNTESLLYYKPLFFHGTRSEEEDDYYLNDDDSLMSSTLAEDITGSYRTNHAARASRNVMNTHPGRKAEGGPIIFYKRAKFCTDLSGDAESGPSHAIEYSRYTDNVVGCKATLDPNHRFGGLRSGASPDSESSNYSSQLSQRVTAEDPTPSPEKPTGYLGLSGMTTVAGDLFRASGIGGVQPRDHFAIEVQTQQFADERNPQITPLRSLTVERKGRRFFRDTEWLMSSVALTEDKAPPFHIRSKIVSVKTTVLVPSALPPPSYIYLPLSSSSDEDDEMADPHHDHIEISDRSTEDDVAAVPEFSHRDSTIASLDSYVVSEGGSEDSSIDLLAHARRLDPDAIAAQEREFENNVVRTSKSTSKSQLESSSSKDLIDSDRSSCGESSPEALQADFELQSTIMPKRRRTDDDNDAYLRRKTRKIDPLKSN